MPPIKTAKKPESNVLLETLVAFKKGDFSVRMPVDLTGMDGKIADALNDILELNEKMANTLDRISRSVGKRGRSPSEPPLVPPAAAGRRVSIR